MTPAKLKIKFGGFNQLDLVERLLVWHKQACLILNCKVKSFVARYGQRKHRGTRCSANVFKRHLQGVADRFEACA